MTVVLDWLWRLADRLLPLLTRRWRRPVGVHVSGFAYEDKRPRPSDAFIIVGSLPTRYRLGIRLKNRAEGVIFIERISIAHAAWGVPKEPSGWKPLRLEPGEPKEEDFFFALDENEKPAKAGILTIAVVPSIGSKTEVEVPLPFCART